jgi:hypothetical protein
MRKSGSSCRPIPCGFSISSIYDRDTLLGGSGSRRDVSLEGLEPIERYEEIEGSEILRDRNERATSFERAAGMASHAV